MITSKSYEEKLRELLVFTQAAAARGASHQELWNSVFGIGARYGRLFPSKTDRDAVDGSQILTRIRSIIYKAPKTESSNAKNGQLSLKLPKSLHEALENEANKEGTSLNQLIITKLAVQLNRVVQR